MLLNGDALLTSADGLVVGKEAGCLLGDRRTEYDVSLRFLPEPDSVGSLPGSDVGASIVAEVGAIVGVGDGSGVGVSLVAEVGAIVGIGDGSGVGASLGVIVGRMVGVRDGSRLGVSLDVTVGERVAVGDREGMQDGLESDPSKVLTTAPTWVGYLDLTLVHPMDLY